MNGKRWIFVSIYFLLLFMAQAIGCFNSQAGAQDIVLDDNLGVCIPAEQTIVEETGGVSDVGERIMLSLLAVRLDVGGPVIGSGILVELDGAFPYMMTAYHVVDHMFERGTTFKQSACHVGVYSRQENCVDIIISEQYREYTFIDISRDAALIPLSYWPEGGRPAETPVQSYNFRIGEEVLVIGCPTGIPDILTRGIVTGFAAGVRNRPMTDAATWFGTSGGGVFLPTGEYVGYFHSMIGSRTPNGREMAEGLHIFSPLPGGWGLAD